MQEIDHQNGFYVERLMACVNEFVDCVEREIAGIGASIFASQKKFAFARTLLWVAGVLLMFGSAGIANGESVDPTVAYKTSVYQSADDALGGHQYPWYDPQTRSLKPIKPESGQAPRSIDRATVPVAQPPPNSMATGKNLGAPPIGPAGGGGAGAESVGTIIGVIGGILIVVVMIALMLTFLRIESQKLNASVRDGRSRQQSIEQLPFDLETDDGDFQSVAQAAYQNGDFNKAIVYLYSHILVTLDQHHLIRLRKGKTNRQYLSEVGRRPGVSDYFQQVMLPFEAVFFGNHNMSAKEFERCWNGLSRFQTHVKHNAEVAMR